MKTKGEVEGNLLEIKGQIDLEKDKLSNQKFNDSNKHTQEMKKLADQHEANILKINMQSKGQDKLMNLQWINKINNIF